VDASRFDHAPLSVLCPSGMSVKGVLRLEIPRTLDDIDGGEVL
jgi:hypothetical protein